MAGKKYTVIIIPDKSSGTRRFGIASRTVWAAAICVLSLIAVNIFLVKDRVSLERKILHLQPLQKLLESLGNRIQALDGSLESLQKLEKQLRIMASVKPRDLQSEFGLGGISKDDQSGSMEGLSPSGRRFVNRLNRQFLDLEHRAASQQRAFEDLVSVFREKKVTLAHTPSVLPARGWLTSGFGRRYSPFTGRREF
ncbi:MAG: hypothetical protein VCF07_12950, partial [Nitrospinota bacterium]